MKVATLTKPNFTAEFWDFTAASNELTGTLERDYFFVERIGVVVSINGRAGEANLFSPIQLKTNAELRDMRDLKGVPFYATDGTTSATIYIGTGEPVFSVFGNVQGFRYTIRSYGTAF